MLHKLNIATQHYKQNSIHWLLCCDRVSVWGTLRMGGMFVCVCVWLRTMCRKAKARRAMRQSCTDWHTSTYAVSFGLLPVGLTHDQRPNIKYQRRRKKETTQCNALVRLRCFRLWDILWSRASDAQWSCLFSQDFEVVCLSCQKHNCLACVRFPFP